MKKQTDRDRLLAMLEAGPVLSSDARRQGISGNPSERVRELEARGHQIDKELTTDPMNGRRAARYTLVTDKDLTLPV